MTETATEPRQERAIVAIRSAVEDRLPELAQVLPPGADPQRFVRTALIAISKNPDLMGCTRESLVRSIFEAAEIGLEPTGSLSRAWLVPFRPEKGRQPEATLIIGYQGLADLMRDTGHVTQVWAGAVYEGDEFSHYEDDEGQHFRHERKYATEDPAKLTFAYARARYRDGHIQTVVLPRWRIEQIRSKSRQRNGKPWVENYPEMAQKSALRQLANYTPLSTSTRSAIERDDEREFGAAGAADAKPQPQAEAIRERLRRQNAPGRPEGARPDTDSAPPADAAGQPSAGADAGDPTEVEGTATAICGAQSSAELGQVETCNLPPGHDGKVHKRVGPDGDVLVQWPVAPG